MTPFGRFALPHALGVCGDLFVTVSLADSLFLSVEPGAAKGKVLQYLLLTMAPFAVVAPFVGPAVDRSRGGRRMMFILSLALRAALCLVLAGHFDDVLLYPLVLLILVCGKAQGIAKSAIVPYLVAEEGELVRANSRLALIAVLAGTMAAAPAGLILKVSGGPWVLRCAAAVFLLATAAGFGIPKPPQAPPKETDAERKELHASSILVAGTAMGFLRGAVGFMTFFVAFVLKRENEPTWVFGLVIAASAIGGGLGNVVAPLVRRVLKEEWILAWALMLPGLIALLSARGYDRTLLVISATFIAMGASCGRLAFDSIVQRDAPDADRGRAFARFETRFQLVWVAGGVLAVAVPFTGRAGLFLLAMSLLFAGMSYAGTVARARSDEGHGGDESADPVARPPRPSRPADRRRP